MQNLALSDLHYFPTWEKEVHDRDAPRTCQGCSTHRQPHSPHPAFPPLQVHDVLQETFPDLTAIFSFYSKSIGGSTTAEDAVEMTMTEFKDLVKDVNLETKDLRFEQMQVLFMKANALNSEEAHAQRAAEKLDKESKLENARAGGNKLEGKKAPARRASASAAREDEKDQELVLYEFIALLVRISFWRANPYHGIHKLATTLIPFPECLRSMLHEVVLPLAQRDDSALFKDKLAEDEDMQAALTEYKERLKVWFNKETQSMHLCGEQRKIKYEQWQEVLKKGKVIGIWEVHQESDIVGDERNRILHKCSLSLPQAKFAFLNSQSVDQIGAGVASDNSDSTTLDWDEFLECVARNYGAILAILSHFSDTRLSPLRCVARCGVDKYKPCREMSMAAAIRGFSANLLQEKTEEEVLIENTKVRATRFDWKRGSQPLEGQKLAAHRKWLEVWERLEVMDMHYFPLWEKELHDVLQRHFPELTKIFLAYTKSIGGSGSAEVPLDAPRTQGASQLTRAAPHSPRRSPHPQDAIEMDMSEFKDFVEECSLETREIDFAQMTIQFTKANAVNTAQVAQERMEGR